MKIKYAQNPLLSIIELDDTERTILWYRIKVKEMEEMLFEAHFYLQEGREYFSIERARTAVEADYYCTDDKSPLDKRVDMLYECALSELTSRHSGDCTCFACSCAKCWTEQLLGIDTIKGLGKHEAHKIQSIFHADENISAAEALVRMQNQAPIEVTKDWHEQHIERWRAERIRALEWFSNYTTTLAGTTVDVDMKSINN